jgi:hypothetical protein
LHFQRLETRLGAEFDTMMPRDFTVPLGHRLPALERNLLRLRVMQMTLILFYAEELKRKALDLVQKTDSLRARLTKDGSYSERIPIGSKKAVDKALNALVADGALTAEDKAEIVSLIDYRNHVAHQTQNLLVDLSTSSCTKEILHYSQDRATEFDYTAVERFQHFLNLLGNVFQTHRYVLAISMNRIAFESAERALLADIKQLRGKVERLYATRKIQMDDLNAELKLAYGQFNGDLDPRHPLNHYDDKRMTKRGVEICYRLFDGGLSDMATAHLMGISLVAVRKRRCAWLVQGGSVRLPVDIATLPRRKFYRSHDD